MIHLTTTQCTVKCHDPATASLLSSAPDLWLADIWTRPLSSLHTHLSTTCRQRAQTYSEVSLSYLDMHHRKVQFLSQLKRPCVTFGLDASACCHVVMLHGNATEATAWFIWGDRDSVSLQLPSLSPPALTPGCAHSSWWPCNWAASTDI